MNSKKIPAILIFSAFLLLPLGAKNFSFEIEPFSLVKIGTLGEYVYNSYDEKVSFLAWELEPLWEVGISSGLCFGDFSIGGKFSFGLPFDTGKMRDSDWGYTASYPYGFKYIYSENPIQQKLNFDSAISISYEFNLPLGFSISPKIAAQYSYNSFETHDGYGWYGTSTDHDENFDIPYDDERANYYTTLFPVEYFRHSVFSWFGFSLASEVGRFFFNGEFLVSPFTYESAIDYHHGKVNPRYTMILAYAYFSRFKYEFDFGCHFTKHFALKFFFGGLFGDTTKADHYIRQGTKNEGYKNFKKTSQKTASTTNYFFLGISAKFTIN